MKSVEIFDQLTHPEDREKDKRLYEELINGKCEQVHLDKRYVLRDGREVIAEVDISFLRDSDGKPEFLLGMAVDVTHNKRAEAELHRAKEAAEAASEAKSTFLATMRTRFGLR